MALPGVVTFDLAVPVQVFADVPWAHEGPTRYDVVVCAPTRTVPTDVGFGISVDRGLEAVREADTVVVPGYRDAPWAAPSSDVLDALRTAAGRGTRLVSICTGAFALGHAGLLDGRRATTHWAATELLAACAPAVDVVSDVLYVDEGNVLTSAGLASGIDLALHVVRRDHGAHVAAQIARWNVLAPHRDGAQAQFVSTGVADGRGTSLAEVCAWALGRLDSSLELADLAARAGLSERSLLRRFRTELGTSPLQWVLRARLDRARELLERTDRSVEQVARDAGFPTAAALRARFAAALGTTPTDYRRRFATGGRGVDANGSRGRGAAVSVGLVLPRPES